MAETTSCRHPLQEVQQNGQNWRGPDSSNALAGCLEVNLRQQREGSHVARSLRSFSSLVSIGSSNGENSFLLQVYIILYVLSKTQYFLKNLWKQMFREKENILFDKQYILNVS